MWVRGRRAARGVAVIGRHRADRPERAVAAAAFVGAGRGVALLVHWGVNRRGAGGLGIRLCGILGAVQASGEFWWTGDVP